MINLRHNNIKMILVLLLCVSALVRAETSTPLFSEVETLLEQADKLNAKYLSPKNYGAATSDLHKAKERAAKNQPAERIDKDLRSSIQSLNDAIQAAKNAELNLATSLQARSDALSAQADEYAKEEWQEGEDTIQDAIRTLENGELKWAQKYSAEAEQEFRAAELTSIKANYLDETRRLLKEAQKNKIHKQAPMLLAKAEENLNLAEKMLSENRYDTDEARYKAQQAKTQVLHANKVSELVLKLKDKDITPEQLILTYEEYIQKIGNNLDLNTQFHQGYDKPLADINNEIASLQKNVADLVEVRREATTLKDEITKLEGKLGIQSQKLAQQQAAKARFLKLERLFSEDEAGVIMQAGDPVVRLIGLNFNVGSAQINSEYFSILKKLQRALKEYPGRKYIIEGHTDSFGGDMLNQELSQKRADSVRDYLLANMEGLRATDIEAKGYGESHPIASNETDQGRKKNRRIDVRIVENN